MSYCTIHIDKNSSHQYQKLKFQTNDNGLDVERVLPLLRSGSFCDGGFLVNSNEEVVFVVQPGHDYYFMGFKRHRSPSMAEDGSQVVPSSVTAPVSFQPTKVTTTAMASIPNNKEKKSKTNNIKVGGDELPNGKRPKKAPKEKDPYAPKKSLSGYLLFSNEKSAEVRQSEPDIKPREVMERLGALWRQLSDEQKSVYLQVAERDKLRYDRELEVYLAEHPESVLHQQLAYKKPKKDVDTTTATASSSLAAVSAATSLQKKIKQPISNISYGEEEDEEDEEEEDEEEERVTIPKSSAFASTSKPIATTVSAPATKPSAFAALSAEVSKLRYVLDSDVFFCYYLI